MTALDHIRVVELANERISFAGKLLADMGADVILVEPPGGDRSRYYPPFVDDDPGGHRSLYFMHYNHSKRAVVLAMDEPEVIRLIETLTADRSLSLSLSTGWFRRSKHTGVKMWKMWEVPGMRVQKSVEISQMWSLERSLFQIALINLSF